MDLEQTVRQLIERNTRHVSFEEQIELLVSLVATGKVGDLPYRTEEDRLAFGQALERIGPRVTPDIAKAVARNLILELSRREIDRAVASVRTESPPICLPESDPTKGLFQVIFVDDGEPLRNEELSEFLMLFEHAYRFGIELQEQPGEILRETKSFVRDRDFYVDLLNRRPPRSTGVASLTAPLVIAAIRKASPLTIWFSAMSSALAVAAIISGGEVDLSKGKFVLHPIGLGLEQLKHALGSDKTPKN